MCFTWEDADGFGPIWHPSVGNSKWQKICESHTQPRDFNAPHSKWNQREVACSILDGETGETCEKHVPAGQIKFNKCVPVEIPPAPEVTLSSWCHVHKIARVYETKELMLRFVDRAYPGDTDWYVAYGGDPCVYALWILEEDAIGGIETLVTMVRESTRTIKKHRERAKALAAHLPLVLVARWHECSLAWCLREFVSKLEENRGRGKCVCWTCRAVKWPIKEKLQKCDRCQTARYCSKECQLRDWPTHKRKCSILATEAPALEKLEMLTKLAADGGK